MTSEDFGKENLATAENKLIDKYIYHKYEIPEIVEMIEDYMEEA